MVTAPTLTAGKSLVEGLLDVPMGPRGVHDAMGTHNHTVSLGGRVYLEAISVDPDGRTPDFSRWFGLDTAPKRAGLTNWVMACADLEEAAQMLPDQNWRAHDFKRGPFEWRILLPQDGVPLFDGCFPALIEWRSEHPTASMTDHGLRLRRLKLIHPEGDKLATALAPFMDSLDCITVAKGRRASLMAEVSAPTGEIWLT